MRVSATAENNSIAKRQDSFSARLTEPAYPTFHGGSYGTDTIFRKASCACGGGCPTCQAQMGDLNISQPGDPAEIEADQIADRVMRMPVGETAGNKYNIKSKLDADGSSSTIRRKCDACEEEDDGPTIVQRKESVASSPPNTPPADAPPSIRNVISSGGQPLDLQARSFFEPRFGTDLGHVRVHTGPSASESARKVSAKAYTVGSNIVFGGDEYKPNTESGKNLIAHELAHTIQQHPGQKTIQRMPTGVNSPDSCTSSFTSAGEGTITNKEEGGEVPYNMDGIPTRENPTGNPLKVGGKTIKLSDGDTVHVGQVGYKFWRAVCLKVSDRENPEIFWVRSSHITLGKKAAPAPAQTPAADKATPGAQKTVAVSENVDLSTLLPWELESEINNIRSWLNDNPTDSAQREDMTQKLALYEAEAMTRVEAERKAAADAKPAADNGPVEDINELERARNILRNGIYVSPIDQGASGTSAEGPGDRAAQALASVDERFLVPADEVPDAVGRLNASIAKLDARIAKANKFIANWTTGTKLTKAIESAIGQLGPEIGERLKEMLTPEALLIMAGFATAYVLSQTTPIGWIADILVAGMLAATILMVGQEAIEIVKLLIKFVDRAESAKTQSDIDAAGQALAIAITKAGVDIILAILLHKAGKAANLKPQGPRSAGLVEVLKTTGEKVMTEIREPAGQGWQVDCNGACAMDPGGFNMSMMEAPETTAGPKAESGSGKGSGSGPNPTGEPAPAEPLPGKGLGGGTGFANEASLKLNKWLGRDIKPGDPLPDGYNWDGDRVRRNPGKAEGNYAPLEVENGKLQIGEGSKRISNPSTMNRNYKASVEAELRSKNPTWDDARIAAEVKNAVDTNAVHHLIPDNVVQRHPLAKLAKTLGYDLDRGSNLKGLPKNKVLAEGSGDTGHWTSHPEYDKVVIDKLDAAKSNLESEFKKPIEEIPKERILEEMRKVEDILRKLIEDGNAPTKDGRLGENEPDTPREGAKTAYA